MNMNAIVTSGWVSMEANIAFVAMRPLNANDMEEVRCDWHSLAALELDGSCTLFKRGTDIGMPDAKPFLKKVFVQKEM